MSPDVHIWWCAGRSNTPAHQALLGTLLIGPCSRLYLDVDTAVLYITYVIFKAMPYYRPMYAATRPSCRINEELLTMSVAGVLIRAAAGSRPRDP